MDMDKLIVVHYVRFEEDISRCDFEERLGKYYNSLYHEGGKILNYIIPVYDGDTRIECINPRLISEEDYLDVKNILDKIKNIS